MPYKRNLLIYFAVWFIAAGVIGVRWLQDSNFFIVFGVGLLMAIAMLVIGRWLFGRISAQRRTV